MVTLQINPKKYFYVQAFTCHTLGLDLRVAKILYMPWFTFSIMTILFGLNICSVRFALEHIKQIDLLAEASGTAVQCVLALIKISLFIYKRQELATFVKYIMHLNDLVADVGSEIIKEENNMATRTTWFYTITAICTGSAALVTSWVVCGYAYFKSGVLIIPPPLVGNFLIDMTVFRNGVIVWVLCLLGIYCVVNTSAMVESVYCWYAHNIVAQFRVLQVKLQRVANALANESLRSINVFEEGVLKCIDDHQKTIRVAEELNKVYQPLIFVEFTFNSLQLCFLAYQIGRGTILAKMPFFIIFFLSVMTQLMIYCYSAQRVQDASLDVGVAMFKILPWDAMRHKFRNLMVLPLLRSQKPVKLKGIFFEVNLSLYVTVLRTAMTYVTLLRSLQEDAK